MKDTDKTKGQPIVKEFGVKPQLNTLRLFYSKNLTG